MKVTRLGPAKPILSLAGRLGGTGGVSGNVPTADGSNSVSWGSNVATIRANGSDSNVLLGPHVNFAAGSNITLSTASNTMTIHATGSEDDTHVWMPLTSRASNSGAPELVWDDDFSLIPTLVPVE